MAIFRKKPQNDGPDEGGDAKQEFAPSPEKAAKWFAHAKTMADSYNYESALVYYANGIKFEPDRHSAHERMYALAIQYASKGGKPASGKEVRGIDGPHPVEKFAAAEFAWMKDLKNPALAVKALDAAVKAEQREWGNWASRFVLPLLRTSKKKSLLRQGMELFREVSAWNAAIVAGELVLQLDPTDAELAAELKNLSAQRAMDQGGYEQEAGKEGGYRSFVKDIDKQRELEEAESISGGQSVEERNLARARKEYEASPGVPDVLNRYAQLVKKQGTPEAEELAFGIYMKGFEVTGEYRFRMSAGDIRIDQARRKYDRLTERAVGGPDGAVTEELATSRQALLELGSNEFRERVAKYPTDRQLRYRLGEIEFDLGNFDEAMACFQAAKDEPKLRVRSGYMLGRCFAAESWHREAIDEYRDAIEAIEGSERERELAIRYDLMVSLLALASADRSVDLAREALEICSGIARKDITYRDIRARRKEVDELIRELSAVGG